VKDLGSILRGVVPIAYICNFIVTTQVKPNPASEASKKQQVEEMFDNISPRYDFLNHFLSLGVDYSWRTKVRKNVHGFGAKHILDVATGTADLAIELTNIPNSTIVGVDISQGMLDFGQIKLNHKKLTNRIALQQADSEKLPFEDQCFDAVTVSFGVRNFENLIAGLSEMHRVLKPGGPMVVLEFSKPTNPVFSKLYWFYFKNILPLMGKLLSRSTNAYTYLPQSVAAFPEGEEFVAKAKSAGFSSVTYKPLTFGICTMYTCVK
jgi:demethylmenaquinone methyltransferase/2-methoxy-6-polyprenyl-1,4-benzoquinol methylase